MPKLIEYFGIIVRFFSDEHEPIHVHAFYNKYQVKVNFFIKEGKITRITYTEVKGYKKLPPSKMGDLKELINKYKEEIVNNWIKYFILHERIKAKRITKKLKK